METRLVVFRDKQIRRTLQNNEWWFVIEDVVRALIDSKNPKQYIQKMKQRDPELGKGWVQIVHSVQCWNTAIKSGPVMMAKKRAYFWHKSAFLWFMIALR